MTEAELFAAYQLAPPETGYAAECACGDLIESRLGTEAAVGAAVRIHNDSTVHRQWAEWQEAVHALQRPTRRQCPCHAT